MDNRGITLIELLVVTTIIAILVVALGFSFQGWMGRYRVESQVKEMYVDLMNARTRAMQRNRAHFVVVNTVATDDYQIYEDTDEDGAVPPPIDGGDTPLWTTAKPLQYQSLWAGTAVIDTNGLVSPDPTTIRFDYDLGGDTPDYDCILLETTRINMGQWDGANCVAR